MRKDTGEKQLQSNSAHTLLQSPLKAPPSTTAAHYRLWQEIPEPNLELNRLLNTRNQLFGWENQLKVPALHPSLAPFSYRLPVWEFCEWETLARKVFWRPWQNGRVSINVMRPQEWPPRFPHLCHLSLCQLQGIHSLLNNSLLSLVLCPLFLLLCYIPLSLSQKFARRAHI